LKAVDKAFAMSATMASKMMLSVQNKNPNYFIAWISNNIKILRPQRPTKRLEGGRGFCWQQHGGLCDVQVCG